MVSNPRPRCGSRRACGECIWNSDVKFSTVHGIDSKKANNFVKMHVICRCVFTVQLAVTWNAQQLGVSVKSKLTPATTVHQQLIGSFYTTNVVAGSRQRRAVPAPLLHRTTGSTTTHDITRWPSAPCSQTRARPRSIGETRGRWPRTQRTTTNCPRSAATAARRNHRTRPDPRTSTTIPRYSRTSYIAAWHHSGPHTKSSFSTGRGHSPAAETAPIPPPSPRKLRCCGAQRLRNFRVFEQPRNFCNGAQPRLSLGCFGADNFSLWGNLGANWNLWASIIFPFRNFVAVCRKMQLISSLLFHSQSRWARVARLMTLQRSLHSEPRLLFPNISNFCSSLGLYNIDRRCFVVCSQKWQSIKGPK